MFNPRCSVQFVHGLVPRPTHSDRGFNRTGSFAETWQPTENNMPPVWCSDSWSLPCKRFEHNITQQWPCFEVRGLNLHACRWSQFGAQDAVKQWAQGIRMNKKHKFVDQNHHLKSEERVEHAGGQHRFQSRVGHGGIQCRTTAWTISSRQTSRAAFAFLDPSNW